MEPTLIEMIQKIDTWIVDTQADITGDWITEGDKELMQVQMQQLMIAKSNLETVLKTGGQILQSVINV